MDYIKEAEKTLEFSQAMARRGLNAVTAPNVVFEFSTPKVYLPLPPYTPPCFRVVPDSRLPRRCW